MTMAKMAARIVATRFHWNRLSAESSVMPMPPAPTSPRTADLRTLMSQRNKAIDQNAGLTCGQYPKASLDAHGAPAASSASIGPVDVSSKASPKSLPTNPIDRKAIASVPAKAPGPKMPTKSSAHTSELTERDDTRTSLARRLTGANGHRLCAASTPTGSASIRESKVPSD